MRSRFNRLTVASAIVAGSLLSACSAVEHYSRQEGRLACAELDRCMVYDKAGERDEPCIAMRRRELYPGDSDWPFEPGVCPSEPSSTSVLAKSS